MLYFIYVSEPKHHGSISKSEYKLTRQGNSSCVWKVSREKSKYSQGIDEEGGWSLLSNSKAQSFFV